MHLPWQYCEIGMIRVCCVCVSLTSQCIRLNLTLPRGGVTRCLTRFVCAVCVSLFVLDSPDGTLLLSENLLQVVFDGRCNDAHCMHKHSHFYSHTHTHIHTHTHTHTHTHKHGIARQLMCTHTCSCTNNLKL